MSETKIFVSDVPKLLSEWDFEKNITLNYSPETTTHKSNKKIWWICELGHSWQDTAGNRSLGRDCPYCSGHRVWIGFNDLMTTHSTLCEEWDYEANFPHKPTEFSKGSSYKAWWKCPSGHTYQSTIANRTSLNRGCPYCSGRYAIKGENDLKSVNPQLSLMWDYSKNGTLTPDEILPNSNKKVWWIGSCGHSWQYSICLANKNGLVCPICLKNRFEKEQSLAVVNPTLAGQWHPTKNGELTPADFYPNSNKIVWWLCEKGHEHRATINNKNRGRGCPVCNAELKTSFPEQAIYFYLKSIYSDAINRYSENGFELDIFIPSLKIGIEYDGMAYHTDSSKVKEQKKDVFYNGKGITVIRVKEYKDDVDYQDTDILIFHKVNSSYHHLDDAIKRLFTLIPKMNDIDVDVSRDDGFISTMYLSQERNNSITNQYPDLLHEWDYEKNGFLNPEYVSCKSTKKRWWKCKYGHSYKLSPSKRTQRKQGCPYCSGRYATNENNLLITNPNLCLEWNYEKNCNKLPENFTPVSGQKAWWKCKICGNEWETTVANRVRGSGCPQCGDKNRQNSFIKTIVKKNGSFGLCYPELLKDWDYSKNDIDPLIVPRFSGIKVWWKCHICDNEWVSSIHNRAKGRQCSKCALKNRALHRGRPVLQYSLDGKIIKKYSSATEASKETGASSITACCKHQCKTSGGYIWRYADEIEE